MVLAAGPGGAAVIRRAVVALVCLLLALCAAVGALSLARALGAGTMGGIAAGILGWSLALAVGGCLLAAVSPEV